MDRPRFLGRIASLAVCVVLATACTAPGTIPKAGTPAAPPTTLALPMVTPAPASVGPQRLADAPTSTPGSTLEGGLKVDVGGHALWIRCSGQGSPPVVLEAGSGNGAASWAKIQPGVAQFTRACAYDRAGLGASDPGPNPTTSRQQVEDLRALLTNARLAGPYVFVGHSFGGMNVELYARLYPAEAAGLVLVDAAHEASYLDPAFRSTNGRVRGGVDFIESARQVQAAPPLPDIPLIVLAHGRPGAPLGTDEQWRAWQKDLATRAPRGKLVVADRSGHDIELDQPDLVIASVREVVEQARR
jgi:pimeloyl-ACP methyl ester carboxylesterase